MAAIVKDASKKIDSYFYNLENSEVREMCIFLRDLVHTADPAIIEDWKWGPNFNKNGMVCWIAGFKAHANITFFKGALLKDPKKTLLPSNNLHNRSLKFTSLKEIKPKIVIALLKEAIKLNLKGIEIPKETRTIELPGLLATTLEKHRLTEKFKVLTYTHKKEYIDWVTSAKKEETTERRLKKLIDLLENKQK